MGMSESISVICIIPISLLIMYLLINLREYLNDFFDIKEEQEVNNIIKMYTTSSEKEQLKRLSNSEKSREFVARYSAIVLQRYRDIEEANNKAERMTSKLKKEYDLQ